MQMPEPVLTKADFAKRYAQGEFGNASPTYQTFPDFKAKASGAGLFHLRNKIAGGETHYNLPRSEVLKTWQLKEQMQQWYCSEMAPHHMGTVQGEVMCTTEHLTLTFCSARLPMRESEAKFGTSTVTGIIALEILRKCMDPSSFDWMGYLFETYPDHVLEFSCFERPWGTIPRRNTVWWEVRLY